MTATFSILNLIVGLFGIITSLLICIHFKSNKILNVYLVIIFLLTSIRTLSYGISFLDGTIATTENTSAFLSMLFPCMYLYFKNLVSNNNNFRAADLLHFIGPFLLGIILFVYHPYILYYNQIGYFSFIIIGVYYFSVSYILLKKQVWNRKTTVINIQKQNTVLKNWTIFFFIICLLLVVRGIVSLFVDLFLKDYLFGQRYFYVSLIISSILYTKVLITPEILYGYTFFNEKIEEQQNLELILKKTWIFEKDIVINNIQDLELNKKIADKVSRYIGAIETEAIKNTIFRNETINLAEFANQIAIPKSHLVFIFKYHSNLSFIEFSKVIRSLDAIDLIENDFLNVNTLNTLAKKVGFTSYNTFFTSFKEITGVTPKNYSQEYIKKIIIQTKLT
jgi:AraC-like DNA-binding protein